jgi:hypothetical protein
MKRFAKARPAKWLNALGVLAALAFAAAAAAAAAPHPDEKELLDLGFKVLVAKTKVQEDWVRGLPPGQIRAMQRTGKKFFIYPDASRKQIYVGGPAEYAAYQKLHPEELQRVQSERDALVKESAYRGKQAAAMQAASDRDLSDPFLGVSWADLGW